MLDVKSRTERINQSKAAKTTAVIGRKKKKEAIKKANVVVMCDSEGHLLMGTVFSLLNLKKTHPSHSVRGWGPLLVFLK